MTRGRSARGAAIAIRTRELSRRLVVAREHYWRALLDRPQLARPIVATIQDVAETQGWQRRLAVMVGLARRSIVTRRKGDRGRYLHAVNRTAAWLGGLDRDCQIANGCHDAIALWSGRRLPEDHRWAGHRLYPARVMSARWRHYWGECVKARAEREGLRNSIVVENEGLVVSFVAKWSPWSVGHLHLTDLHQAARMGLFRAADLFDPHRQPPIAFSTYAHWWCRHFVFRAYQEHRSDVRAPIGIQALALDVAPIVEELGQDPEVIRAELARGCRGRRPKRASIDQITQALEYMRIRQVSFAQQVGTLDGRGLTLADVIPDPAPGQDEVLDRERTMLRLLAALEDLDPQGREVLERRFGFRGEDEHPAQVALATARTRAEVEALEQRALARLRERVGDVAALL